MISNNGQMGHIFSSVTEGALVRNRCKNTSMSDLNLKTNIDVSSKWDFSTPDCLPQIHNMLPSCPKPRGSISCSHNFEYAQDAQG